jgi:hypothetical protein
MYMANILPHLEYDSVLFLLASGEYLSKLDRIHYRGALYVSGCLHGTNSTKKFKNLGWMCLADRQEQKLQLLMYDNKNDLVPTYISELYNLYTNPVNDIQLR